MTVDPDSPRATRGRRRLLVVAVLLVLAVAGAAYIALGRSRGLPAAGSEAYVRATRQFYRGLAELQVGLLDNAVQAFTDATVAAPGEPAAWANLGLAQLRLGATDAAAPAIARAAQLAPRSSAIAFLQSRLDTNSGRHDAGVADLRRAVNLDPGNLPARMALMQEVEGGGGSDADADAQRVLDDLFARAPENLALIVERARLAAKRADQPTLRDSLRRLAARAAGWPPEVVDQFHAAERASDAADTPGAARELAFLRNTLAAVPAYRESRARVTPPADLIADPFPAFLRLPAASSRPSPPDSHVTFAAAPFTAAVDPVALVTALSPDGDAAPAVVGAGARGLSRIDQAGWRAPLPAAPVAVAALDWNNDFRTDLATAGPDGVHLFIQAADGTLADATPAGAPVMDATGVWSADVEMDGDLDLVVGVRGGAPLVLRNDGDGRWTPTQPFAGITDVRAFAWGDVDHDGDPDAVFIDGRGELAVFANVQAGQFQRMASPPTHPGLRALAVADVDADGVLDVVTLDRTGTVRRAWFADDHWREETRATSAAPAPAASSETAALFVADLDNNGALDLVVSDASGTTVWLADTDHVWHVLGQPIAARVSAVADLDQDGQLDLLGMAGGRAVRLMGKGTLGYHYQVIRPRAQSSAGDQRINSFGIGGEIEVRSGLLVQKQIIESPSVHVGLGTRDRVDVTRIVWPNGVLQADFDLGVDQAIVAQQRLKGSCPWVFADNGHGLTFVTDFLWRSPLGLRINAQDTAGVTQTEDWVRIRGDQLVAREGAYDVRITAELWETHFVDAVALMAVDHPSNLDVFVDERFARAAPALAVHAMRPPRPVARAWDEAGRDVTDLVRAADGRYLDTFAPGRYQGVAADHFVELDLGAPIPATGRTWLVAQGWIYPTDSSINVAIGQGRAVRPRGLSLEALDAHGRWVVVDPDLGFPAGKNKTILVDLSRVARAGVSGAQRLRLRTNLEVYWDSIGVAADVPDARLKTTRLDARTADLRYRGYSVTDTHTRGEPEIPEYARVANVAPRWRDLIGFYTRFGDVRPLLAAVDDRYVIMNAGDELRLSFAAPAPPPAGWTRDFVLVGDGWVKDGDFNTIDSQTVLPLPAHGHPDYGAATQPPGLDQDPVYLAHRDDWRTFHTRFVAPDPFLRGLQ